MNNFVQYGAEPIGGCDAVTAAGPRITAEDVSGACPRQLNVFRKYRPDGIRVTEANAMLLLQQIRDEGQLLDIDWVARRLLTASALAAFERVRARAFVCLYLQQEGA